MDTSYLFVDEAGDTTLFARHGKPLAEAASVSRYFMVGRLEVAHVGALEAALETLRAELLADPLLNTIPSMQVAAGKTALFFHAKDDAPEVRHAMFRLLLRHELKFSAVVRDKHVLLHDVLRRNASDPGYRYKADGHELYDDLSARLFGQCQLSGRREVTFAVRGSKPRTAALKAVLDAIDGGSHAASAAVVPVRTMVHSGFPSQSASLQACDYLLWALQRFYERGEDRYVKAMWPCFTRVLDLDAPAAEGGRMKIVEFNEKHPLTLANRTGVGKKGREI
ncbi:MAG: DUF3800 domain-containing protein [Ramlibacter sp.]